MAGFADINAAANAALDSSQSDNSSNEIESQTDLAPQTEALSEQESPRETRAQKSAIAELERIERFKFQGKEYTPKELGALLAKEKEQEKAFTQKMQSLAEERRQWESSKTANSKYDDALAYDLEKVRNDPSLAQEFIRTYPESYHRHLKAVLSSTSTSQRAEGTPHVPVELMSRVEQLSQYVQKQEVAKAEVEIDRDLTKVLSEFKYASRKEVLADVFEFHNSLPADPATGRKPPVPMEIWSKAAEASHNERVEWGKTYQKDLQQQQKQANNKARDVGSGGGTPGQAPRKFDPKKGMGALHKEVLSHFTKS